MLEISKTEFEVMDALWQGYPASASEIIERLNRDKFWHEKTVKTLLSRLVKKQAIDFEKEQRSYRYFPLVDKAAYVAKESNNLLSRLFSGRVAPLVAGFVESQSMSKQDIEELKAVIEKWEQDNG